MFKIIKWLAILVLSLLISKPETRVKEQLVIPSIIDVSGTCTIAGVLLNITEDSIILFKKDKTYRILISNKTFIVVWDTDRVEHTIPTAIEWFKNNNTAVVIIGVYNGKGSDVILSKP
jgi:hypothetical protein